MRLIDADALKIDYGFTWDDITPTHEEMYALIDRQPTIDAVPVKHGIWIATHERIPFSHPDSITYICSECGYKIYTIYGLPSLTRYCSSCGARMDGERKES